MMQKKMRMTKEMPSRKRLQKYIAKCFLKDIIVCFLVESAKLGIIYGMCKGGERD